MTMADLETAVRERARLIALVFDNSRYGTIWRLQDQRGAGAGVGTRLGSVDFAGIATACGALGLVVRTDEEFEPALRQAMEAGRPAVLHMTMDPRWTTVEAGLGEIQSDASALEPAAPPETDPDIESEAAPAMEPEPETAEVEPELEPALDTEVEPERTLAAEAANPE
jgi:hypothetical protein